MKRIFILLLITLLILNISLSISQETTAPITAALNQSGKISGTEIKEKIAEKTDTALEKEVQIPDNLQTLAKIILGIKGPIEFSLLIIIFVIWLILFKLVIEGVKLMPFFETGIMSWIVALVIMLLIGLSGGLNNGAAFILHIPEIFKIFKDWSTGSLFIGILVVIIVGVGLAKLEKYIKNKSKIEKANIESTELGISLGFMGNLRKMFSWGKKVNSL